MSLVSTTSNLLYMQVYQKLLELKNVFRGFAIKSQISILENIHKFNEITTIKGITFLILQDFANC